MHNIFGHSANIMRLFIAICSLVILSGCNQANALRGAPKMDENSETVNMLPTLSILVGTYTSKEGSQGIYTFDYNPETYTFTANSLAGESTNPSFGAYNKERQHFYSVGETSSGTVNSFSWEPKSKQLQGINTVSSEGIHPCYIALSPNNKSIAVANYSSGNIAVYDLEATTGAIQKSPVIFQHKGEGANKTRQEGPHAHWVDWRPDGRYLYAVDLGVDKIYKYPVDGTTGEVTSGDVAISMPAGAGPRHMVFHPSKPFSYILNELSNTLVATTMQENGLLTSIQTINTLPENFEGQSQGGHIEISADGNYVYASNRGHNSIAVFRVADNGTLTRIQDISTEGKWPRFFMLLADGKSLLVANEHSNNIAAFTIGEDGKLSYTGSSISISKPVYMTTVQ